MCYSVASGTKKNTDYAQFRARKAEQSKKILDALDKIKSTVDPIYFSSGFAHPTLFGFTAATPDVPSLFQWGLIPEWIKDEAAGIKMAKSTLNARIETIAEKPSFKNSIAQNRCVLYLDGFYEYHHYAGKTYPFFIEKKDKSPMAIAAIYTKSLHENRHDGCSIVTTKANENMRLIHNNPKMEGGPRIPVILSSEQEDAWLDSNANVQDLLQLCSTPANDDMLHYQTVGPLIGKVGSGNIAKAQEQVTYVELADLMKEIS